jgi:hypothetical protein
MEPTVEQLTDQLVADVELFSARARPGTRAIVIDDDVRATQEKWNVQDLDVLNPNYLETLRAKRATAYDAETRALDNEIAPRFMPLREAIGQKLADARRLRTESERVDPSLNPERYVNARLLDELTQTNAEAWLAKHENDEPAILKRYTASDDRRDVAFVRLVEQRYGATTEAPGEITPIALPLRKAVRSRQDARVPAALSAALEKLTKAEDAYELAKMEAFPSTETLTQAAGAIFRRAK